MFGGATQYVGKPGLRIGPRYSERSCASLNSSKEGGRQNLRSVPAADLGSLRLCMLICRSVS